MAKSDLIKFRELLSSDEGFQEKFRKAAEAASNQIQPLSHIGSNNRCNNCDNNSRQHI